jgi:hypothetical protein
MEEPNSNYRYMFWVYLFFLALLIAFFWVISGIIFAKETPQNAFMSDSEAYLRPIAPHYTPLVYTLGYLDPEMEELIDCVWNAESSRGQNLFGDYKDGYPRAFGQFQIWLEYHPITYECAMDFECSAGYFVEMVEQGKGSCWTTYPDCI